LEEEAQREVSLQDAFFRNTHAGLVLGQGLARSNHPLHQT